MTTSKCPHEWVWTAQLHISVVGDPYPEGNTTNAVCKLCGTHAWAHGHMPYYPPRSRL